MTAEKYVPNQKIKAYFRILSPRYPKWLDEYINTDPLLKQQYISITCGTIYSDLFSSQFFYSSLDHSVAVALITWHFTKSKKQTLASLFHDVATPVFKHCVDFMNGDYTKQESTEELTTGIIKDCPAIMELLKRDNVKLSEVNNYHIYPIADNDTPKLSADRLEYSLSNALFTYNLASMEEIEKIYKDLSVQQNTKEAELGFKTEENAVAFVKLTSVMSVTYRDDKTRYSMQFLADILKRLEKDGKITRNDLYNLKESEVIDIIKKSKYSDIFQSWRDAREINVSSKPPKSVYSVRCDSKIRYINPLLNGIRIADINSVASEAISNNLSYKPGDYCYLDFNFPD